MLPIAYVGLPLVECGREWELGEGRPIAKREVRGEMKGGID